MEWMPRGNEKKDHSLHSEAYWGQTPPSVVFEKRPLIKSVDGIRMKKKYFGDICKNGNRHWLAANMAGEAYLDFGAFNTKKITGRDAIDFIKFRQNIAAARTGDMEMFVEVLGKPKP